MNTPHLLFGLLILMALAVGALFFIEEVPRGHGFDHPAYPERTIQQAPDGEQRHRSVIWVAGCFGALVSLFTVSSMSLGLCARHRKGTGTLVVLAAGVVYTLLLIVVVFLYWNFIDKSAPAVLGFPVSTAWMLFLFGPSPLALVALYMATFPRWILTTQDMETFHDLVAARRKLRAD